MSARNIGYRKLVGNDTFIAQYMDAMDNSETATAYDFWCACWALSAAIGRGIYVDRPNAPVFLNWYMVLVAESGVTRKSTSLNRATKIVRNAIGDEALWIESGITKERLYQDIAMHGEQHGHGETIFSVSEMVTVFGKERHSMQLPGVLTDLYDAPHERAGGGTLGRAAPTMRNVCINLLSASTPTWLMRSINPDIIEGGFTSRTIFVVAAEPKRRIAWASSDERNETVYSNLSERLGQIRAYAKLRETISITEGGLRRFRGWYSKRELNADPFVGSFQSREDAHVLRMAAILAINDASWDIDTRHVTAAIRLIAEARDNASSMFSGTVNPDRILHGIDRVRTILVECGADGIQHSKLYARVRRDLKADEALRLLDMMHELDMVTKMEVYATANAKRAQIRWFATAKTLEVRSYETIKSGMFN